MIECDVVAVGVEMTTTKKIFGRGSKNCFSLWKITNGPEERSLAPPQPLPPMTLPRCFYSRAFVVAAATEGDGVRKRKLWKKNDDNYGPRRMGVNFIFIGRSWPFQTYPMLFLVHY